MRGRSWGWTIAVAALAAACGDARDVNEETPATPSTPTPTPTEQVSFEQQIHPLLQQKCAACHGAAWGSSDASTSYQAALAEVDKANPAQSALYVKGNGGAAHPGGDALTDAEAALLLAWIQQGATGPATAPPTTPPPAAVSFSQQVHPRLVADCGGCHGSAWGSSDVATSYAAAAARVNTAAPDQSALYVKGNGSGHGGGDRLSDADAALLLQWIQEGAKDN